jgi:hypothetical protein
MVDFALADVQTMLIRGAHPGTYSARQSYPNSIKNIPELLTNAAMANVTTVHLVEGGCRRTHVGTHESKCIKSTIYAR